MARTPFLLLPPSEGKVAGGTRRRTPDEFALTLGDERAAVAVALRTSLERASRHEREQLVNAHGDLARRGLDALGTYLDGESLLMPAWRRYDGVVWRHFAPSSLTGAQRRRVLVPSSLYGVTTANDVIADYRMKMSVRLHNTGVVARFWRRPLTQALAAYVGGSTVVDLLPAEHAAALDVDALANLVDFVRVSFVDAKHSRAVGHDAKAIKGALARRLMLQGLGDLEDFTWQGWRVRKRDGGFVVVAPSLTRHD
ncbi:MAG TPA: peroxide stress protein YaaA [Acidimicrobiales bacterium]|nr:MAG: hypothetical protein B7X07_02010 [Actinobacteria bacterium 21-64-8]HQT99674.1 peroxide stress protein YaaA [Acidimicrobiales bacterium]